MKIAYIITRADSVGGATIHVRDLARAMLERGHEAVVLVGGRGPVTDQLAAAGVPFRAVKFLARAINPLRDLRALAEVTALLRELRPDLVSTHTAKAGWIGRAACARLGLPVLYTPHGWSIGARVSAAQGLAFGLAEKVASRWSSAIICVSEAEKQLALSRRVAPGGKVVVVHSGVRDIPESLRARPEIEPVRICSVARFEPPKDHATLLAALARLQDRRWELDLVGDGPLEATVKRLAGELGLSERVRFLGYQADPERVLAQAQLFALATRSEAFPRSVLEALRAGLPVVASGVGGVAEAVAHGVNGLLVPASDPGALAAALAELMTDAARRRTLGAAARATYQARFRIECMLEGTLGVYAKVLGPRFTQDAGDRVSEGTESGDPRAPC